MKLYTIALIERDGREIARGRFFASSRETALSSARAVWNRPAATLVVIQVVAA